MQGKDILRTSTKHGALQYNIDMTCKTWRPILLEVTQTLHDQDKCKKI